MAELIQFTKDFGDGSGPITYYGRRMNLREAKMIDEHKKFLVTFTDAGDKVQTITNASEWLTHAFLALAKDDASQRMFGRADESDRVWTKFSPKAVYDAALELMAIGDNPGN